MTLEGSLACHIDALSVAKSLIEAAPPLVALGKAIGLDRPAVVEDFTSERLLMSRDNGLLGEIFGWVPTPGQDEACGSLHHVCPIGRACRVTMNPFAWRAAEIGAADIAWDHRSRAFWD